MISQCFTKSLSRNHRRNVLSRVSSLSTASGLTGKNNNKRCNSSASSPSYTFPELSAPTTIAANQVQLIASGDLRESANLTCWPAQHSMESELANAVTKAGFEIKRAHLPRQAVGDEYSGEQNLHGFIGSQKEGMDVFKSIDPTAKLIVAEAVWQYSHHVLAGLSTHQGPILTVANWSGQWPGLVGMLNLNGSLTKEGVSYSTLWSEDFTSQDFQSKFSQWLNGNKVQHDLSHVHPLPSIAIPPKEKELGVALAQQLQTNKSIMGVFDEGCMGMYNAILPDNLLHSTGVYKERLSQSALAFTAQHQVSEEEAEKVLQWMLQKGMKFNFGTDEATELTQAQVLQQCRMYIAAMRIADEFGCDTIGIQYQQGLKDTMPASDLAEGTLNDSVRPPVYDASGSRVLFEGEPLPHFNEVDECAGLDGLMTYRIHKAMGQPVENTLHDLRWGDVDHSGTTDEYVWVFLISGAVPPSHFIGGWGGAMGERQPPMYFRLGGSTIKGISKPGEIIWSRIYVQDDALHMDIGRGKVVELPMEETQRRWEATTPQWPIMHAVLYGVTRDQMMAQHKSNHVQVVYGNDTDGADKAMYVKASMAEALGMKVNICGCQKDGTSW